jgi:hypothetical protein
MTKKGIKARLCVRATKGIETEVKSPKYHNNDLIPAKDRSIVFGQLFS